MYSFSESVAGGLLMFILVCLVGSIVQQFIFPLESNVLLLIAVLLGVVSAIILKTKV